MNTYNTGSKRAAYTSATEFMQIVEEAFSQACERDPNDPTLQDIRRRVAQMRDVGQPGAAEAEMRKWYSKGHIAK